MHLSISTFRDINGLDLIKQLKTFNPQMLVVVISGYDDFAYARQAIQLNVFDYLLKPLAPSDVGLLLQKIEQKILHQTSSQVKTNSCRLCRQQRFISSMSAMLNLI